MFTLRNSLTSLTVLIFKHLDFNNQLKIADTLLKAYQYRYDKFKIKTNTIVDIIGDNYEHQKECFQKSEKLDSVDAKLTQVEVKLHLLFKKVEALSEKIELKQSVNK